MRFGRVRPEAAPYPFAGWARAIAWMAILSSPSVSAQVTALGRIEPLHGPISITAPVTPESTGGAVLRELAVQVGDDVKAGQLLAVTETASLMDAWVAEVKAEREHHRRLMVAAEAEARATCALADGAESESRRRRILLERNLGSAEEAERARSDADARLASCAAAKASAGAAQAGVVVIDARVKRVQAARERSFIRAPFDGRVIQIHSRPGEMVGNQGVLELGRVDRMYAIAEVYETDIGRVQIGQRAQVSSRALPAPIDGVVEQVRPQVRKQDQLGTDPASRKDARIVEVEIRLDNSAPAANLTNLQVEVTIGT